MSKVQIKLVRSTIDQSKKQKLNVTALGLRKIGSVSEKELNPQIKGMIEKVKHLVEVKEL